MAGMEGENRHNGNGAHALNIGALAMHEWGLCRGHIACLKNENMTDSRLRPITKP